MMTAAATPTLMSMADHQQPQQSPLNSSSVISRPPATVDSSGIEEWAKTCYYSVAVPVMLFFCFVSMVTNLCILVSIAFVRSSLSPTLRFSVSLAGADAYASLVMGLGLVVNSLLPVTFDVDLGSACYVLVLECFRLAGLIISAMHLLLLATNHYVGIIRPLHYVSTVTRRNAMISIGLMWTVPLIFFFAYCSGLEDQGFRSDNCSNLSFFARHHFRVLVSCLFFVPLVLMTVMYCHMFAIVRQHNRGFTGSDTEKQQQKQQKLQPHSRRRCGGGGGGGGHNSRQLRRNVKAAVTTLFILGTYVIGWMPAVVFFVIACDDCPLRLSDMNPTTVFYVAIVTNTLIIVKLFVNPIIYAARMKDIRFALHKMAAVVCLPSFVSRSGAGSFSADSYDDNATSSFVRSRSDKLSTRLQSVVRGSGCSINNHHRSTITSTMSDSSPVTPTHKRHVTESSFVNNRVNQPSPYCNGRGRQPQLIVISAAKDDKHDPIEQNQ